MKLNAADQIIYIQTEIARALRNYACGHDKEPLGYMVSTIVQRRRLNRLDDIFGYSFPLFGVYLEITDESIRRECRKV